MAVLEVLQFPDPRLRRVSEAVGEITDEIRRLADDMLETMYEEPGVGLAAPQVGHAIRLIVVDTDWTEEDADRKATVLINPELRAASGQLTWTEGCLSVPDFNSDVERAERVELRASGLDGEAIVEEVEGLRAVCFQHELDHLEGILFLDRLSLLKRNLYVQKRKKLHRSEDLAGPSLGERPPAPPVKRL